MAAVLAVAKQSSRSRSRSRSRGSSGFRVEGFRVVESHCFSSGFRKVMYIPVSNMLDQLLQSPVPKRPTQSCGSRNRNKKAGVHERVFTLVIESISHPPPPPAARKAQIRAIYTNANTECYKKTGASSRSSSTSTSNNNNEKNRRCGIANGKEWQV